MNTFAVLFLACLVQNLFGYGTYGIDGCADASGLDSYGGIGEGNVAIAGELPVIGETTVTGQVPVIGTVRFCGDVCACGTVSITGKCACRECGCGCGDLY